MGTSERVRLIYRARNWVRLNQCPFPLDLAAEMLGVGLDVGVIEEQLLEENESYG